MYPYKENSDDQVLDLELIYVTIFSPIGVCSRICLCTLVQYGPSCLPSYLLMYLSTVQVLKF